MPAVVLATIVVALGVHALRLAFPEGAWTREHPLVDAISIVDIREGAITLADGRTFRLAGIAPAPGVSADAFADALRTITAQGVTVLRDLGDGRAFLLAEPKFYNWCGTGRWPGMYLQCPVSELLIQSGYAEPDLTHPSLTAREQWRLEGAAHLRDSDYQQTPISTRSSAFRISGREGAFRDYDLHVEAVWKPPPG